MSRRQTLVFVSLTVGLIVLEMVHDLACPEEQSTSVLLSPVRAHMNNDSFWSLTSRCTDKAQGIPQYTQHGAAGTRPQPNLRDRVRSGLVRVRSGPLLSGAS